MDPRNELLAVNPSILTPSYPYPTNRPHLDHFVTMTFDATPSPRPEPKRRNFMDVLLLGSTVGDLGFKVSQGTKGNGFGITSSAEKYQMRINAANAIIYNDDDATEELERVRLEFTGATGIAESTGSTSIAELSDCEIAELEKARRLVEKHDGLKRNGAAALKDGGIKKAQREKGLNGRGTGPKRMYVFQNGKPKNPRKEAAKEN